MKKECYICNDVRQLDGHHIIPEWLKFRHVENFRHGEDNTVFLCKPCHQQLHSLYNKRALGKAFKDDPYYFEDCIALLRINKKDRKP